MKGRVAVLLLPLFILSFFAATAQGGFIWGGTLDVNQVVGLENGTILVASGDAIRAIAADSSLAYATRSVPDYAEVRRPFSAARDGSVVAVGTAENEIIVLDRDLAITHTWSVDEATKGRLWHLQVSPDGERILAAAGKSVFALETRSGAELWRFDCWSPRLSASGFGYSTTSGRLAFTCKPDPLGQLYHAFVMNTEGLVVWTGTTGQAIEARISASGEWVAVSSMAGTSDVYRLPVPIPVARVPGQAFVLGDDLTVVGMQFQEEPGYGTSLTLDWYPLLWNPLSPSMASATIERVLMAAPLRNGNLLVLSTDPDEAEVEWRDAGYGVTDSNITFRLYSSTGELIEKGPGPAEPRGYMMPRTNELVTADHGSLSLFRAGETNVRPLFGEQVCTVVSGPPAMARVEDVVDPDGGEVRILWNWTSFPEHFRRDFLWGAANAEGMSVQLPEDWRERPLSVGAVDDRGAFSTARCLDRFTPPVGESTMGPGGFWFVLVGIVLLAVGHARRRLAS